MQLQPSNRGSIYVLQALIEAPPTVTVPFFPRSSCQLWEKFWRAQAGFSDLT